ncbi:transglutaminase family protein [Pseudanabaena sp. FACHB-2040]|uniref:transglutaminase family protein n=1 Tax=Pseudanabaena sp. FACHB-2040 TaxID=2692859 RepID=UPI0016893B68|nr:transglutaminase family protein [Pseudanabaena sp. FACHB-2040]MBD2259946.1 transglutaminase family protein [Pseudanabaena sp. FACHB-2040]
MRYQIRHVSCYSYRQPVTLRPHVLRLRPRSDATQLLQQFQLTLTPEPASSSQLIELEGNSTLGIWFSADKTAQLTIEAISEVETCRTNPFDYLVEPWAASLPLDYPTSVLTSLQPYLCPPLLPAVDPGVMQLAQALLHDVQGNLGYFLTALTQKIVESCEYTVRESGPPLPAGITWSQKRGSCRDYAVLFMAACQSLGLAARFVSGYYSGYATEASTTTEGDLHAWVEVYIPGGGWRGFDPTHGLAVADRHIALAASAHPSQAAPVTGEVLEGATVPSTLENHITIQVLEER